MLQLQAKKHSGGVCGLGLFVKTQAKADATFGDMINEFAEACSAKYNDELCGPLKGELFHGVNGGDLLSKNPETTKQVCQELNALVAADDEHDDVVDGNSDSNLLARSQGTQGAASLDQALSSKGTPR